MRPWSKSFGAKRQRKEPKISENKKEKEVQITAMENSTCIHGQVKTYSEELPRIAYNDISSYGSFGSMQNNKNSITVRRSKFIKRSRVSQGLRAHVSMGPKLSETVKGKLSLGKRLIQAGSIGKLFTQSFTTEKGERLLKASQCYLHTTAGPIAGVLFISTDKIAFRSDSSLALTTPKGDLIRVPYKVVVPIRNVQKAKQSENMNKPEQKYVQIVTVDGFEFWFLGFVRYHKSFKILQEVISNLR